MRNAEFILRRRQQRCPNAGPDDFVMGLPDGSRIADFDSGVRRVLTAAGLLNDPITDRKRGIYSFRHTYATLLVSSGRVSPAELGDNMGTSLPMIDRHYYRWIADFTVQAIAEEIELSHSGALGRVKRLEESGAIRRHVAEIDKTVFAAWPMLFVEIVLTPPARVARRHLDAAIAAAPEIIEGVEIVGKCDLLLKVALPAPVYWASLQRRLDPTTALIDKARPRVIGRTIKRAGVHPASGTLA